MENIVTGKGRFEYYDEVPVIIFNGENFERSIYGDEARELYLKIIGIDKKDER